MRTIRSFLFTPAHKASWIDKAANSGADALILDLEDSVPYELKAEALKIATDRIKNLSAMGKRVYVRINRGAYIYSIEEIMSLVQPGLEGLMLPKPEGVRDIDVAHAMVSEAEVRMGMPLNSVVLAPVLETAGSLVEAREIASHERVGVVIAASSKGGDVARSLGIQWTKEGLESLHLRSSGVAAARAAGKVAIGGLWHDVHDLEGLAEWAAVNRQLGFHGELALHPTNVPAINAAYSPSPEEVEYCAGMIEAFAEAQAAGRSSFVYQGEHVDQAHISTAKEVLAFAQSLDRSAQS